MKNLISSSVCFLLGSVISIAPATAEKINTASLFQPRQSSRPSRTMGGATRNADRCGQKPTVSYVGMKDQKPTLAWQLSNHTAPEAEISVFDRNGKGLYQTTVPLSGTLQEVMVTLPQNLQGNQEYQWVFSLVCQPNERLQDQTILGWIEYAPVK